MIISQTLCQSGITGINKKYFSKNKVVVVD
jgi:hypothetical protein